jgi:TATA-binding protein-associated factor Taf7
MKLQTNVFYISLLELASKNIELATDVTAEDEEEEWDIEEILDLRINNKKQLEYLVKWLDFGLEDNL